MAASKKALLGVEESLDTLRQLIAKVAASVYATEDLFEKLIWDDRTDEESARAAEALAPAWTRASIGNGGTT